ncbi:MAG: hypothetical protein OEW24_04015, partial [Chloroflexota bacterium]|nr:hypothetical protein [Chloroflexota bacterium]
RLGAHGSVEVLVQLGLRQRTELGEVHLVMIRGRPMGGVMAGIGILAIGSTLCLRPADPTIAAPEIEAHRRAGLAAAANSTDALLEALVAPLDSALHHARAGAAGTRSGEVPPAAEFEAAALAVEQGSSAADALGRALRDLVATASSVAPGFSVPPSPPSSSDLLIVAAQLRASGDAASEFFERRRATTALNEALGAAVEALRDDDPYGALDRLADGDPALALLVAWEQPPETFGFWLTTIGELYAAAREIATATIAGDEEAVARAAARYGAAAESARGADNALALALAEGSSAVSINAQRRIADLLDEALTTRAAIATLITAN